MTYPIAEKDKKCVKACEEMFDCFNKSTHLQKYACNIRKEFCKSSCYQPPKFITSNLAFS
jgi:hypothetical protein